MSETQVEPIPTTRRRGRQRGPHVDSCPLPALVSQGAVIRHFRVGKKTLQRWVSEYGFPRPITLGTRVYYHTEELRAYVAALRAPKEGVPA